MPGDVGAADNGLHDGPWHVSRHNQVGEQLERTEPAGLAGQTEAPLSVFTGATISQLPSILVTKEGQNSMRSQRPYLSLFVILRKGSVMALIYFVLFLQSFVLLLKSNALHESFPSKESV